MLYIKVFSCPVQRITTSLWTLLPIILLPVSCSRSTRQTLQWSGMILRAMGQSSISWSMIRMMRSSHPIVLSLQTIPSISQMIPDYAHLILYLIKQKYTMKTQTRIWHWCGEWMCCAWIIIIRRQCGLIFRYDIVILALLTGRCAGMEKYQQDQTLILVNRVVDLAVIFSVTGGHQIQVITGYL